MTKRDKHEMLHAAEKRFFKWTVAKPAFVSETEKYRAKICSQYFSVSVEMGFGDSPFGFESKIKAVGGPM